MLHSHPIDVADPTLAHWMTPTKAWCLLVFVFAVCLLQTEEPYGEAYSSLCISKVDMCSGPKHPLSLDAKAAHGLLPSAQQSPSFTEAMRSVGAGGRGAARREDEEGGEGVGGRPRAARRA